jgi:hypothetical protein
VYGREVLGEHPEFGVSGQLYNSDLLMYDRLTGTLWEQVSGIAVVGELAGSRLAYYPSQIMTWRDWQAAYPESEVMSRFTGFQREYEGFPYASYFDSDDVWFEVAAESPQLFAKEFVVGVELPGEAFVAYLEADLAAAGALNDTAGGVPLVVAADPSSGTVVSVFERRVGARELTFALEGEQLVDRETGTRWTLGGIALEGELAGSRLEPLRALRLFWFAWVAFHPDTQLRRPDA